MTQLNSDQQFLKLEELLRTRGLQFTPAMKFQYFNDPMFKALFTLILELAEKAEEYEASIDNWDPWEDF